MKMNLQEATLKALYNELEDKNEYDNVEGIIDDVLVITDPEVNTDEYDEIIERAQEIVEETPEGNIPLDDEYIGQYAQTCPICGATFVTDNILEPGATCPICLETPEAFVMKGKLATEEQVAGMNGIPVDEQPEEEIPNPTDAHEHEDEKIEEPKEDKISKEDDEKDLEKDTASKEIPQGNVLTENKEKIEETGEWDDEDDEMSSWLESMRDAAKYIADKIKGEVRSVTGFDKYQGPRAVIKSPKHGDVMLWYDNEDDTGRSFICKIGHVGTIQGDMNSISDLLDKEEIPTTELLQESVKEEEVADIRTQIEDAESIEDIQDIIYSISDNNLENEAQLALDQSIQDDDDLDTVKDFIIATIEDNAVYEESKEIKTEEQKLEEFTYPNQDEVAEWESTQIARWIIDHYKDITKVDLADVYNKNEDEEELMFNDEVIDETAPAIEDALNRLGINDKKKEDVLYDLDDILISERSKFVNINEAKSNFEKSMDALDEIDRLANGDEKLAKLGRELGLADFKKYLQDNHLLKEDIQENIEEIASISDIEDLETIGDALDKLYNVVIGGESDFLNINYRDELADICDRFDKILQAAKESRKSVDQ